MAAKSHRARRYDAVPRRTMAAPVPGSNSRLRAAISRLAARRLMSHSKGPGMVSSKSFTSKRRSRSGAENVPKFMRWASPHSWVVRPVGSSWARSAAITAAAPR